MLVIGQGTFSRNVTAKCGYNTRSKPFKKLDGKFSPVWMKWKCDALWGEDSVMRKVHKSEKGNPSIFYARFMKHQLLQLTRVLTSTNPATAKWNSRVTQGGTSQRNKICNKCEISWTEPPSGFGGVTTFRSSAGRRKWKMIAVSIFPVVSHHVCFSTSQNHYVELCSDNYLPCITITDLLWRT